jgi:hypothetical protein
MSSEQEARLRVLRRMREDAEQEAELVDELGKQLAVVLHFAENAKANGYLEEFETLMEEVDELVRHYRVDMPGSVKPSLKWLTTARPEQLEPRRSWPSEEQVRTSATRLETMVDRKEREPEGGSGVVDCVVAELIVGPGDPSEAATPRERWQRLVAARIRETLRVTAQ